MDVPTAALTCTIVITAGSLAYKLIPPRKPKTTQPVCPHHASMETRLVKGDDRMDKILRLTVAIAAHLDIPMGNLKEELQDIIEGG